MRHADIDALVRQHLPNARLYDWRGVEQMREDLARYGVELSRAEAGLVAANAKLAAVAGIQQQLRAVQNYALADQLRASITSPR